MTIEELIHRRSRKESDPAETESTEEYPCFGFLRGQRERAFALELRKKTGEILALPYHLFESVRYAPATGIHLKAAGQEITIDGRNLNGGKDQVSLFAAITRQRVVWIGELQRGDLASAASIPPTVESIHW